jgi:hypothetical protein
LLRRPGGAEAEIHDGSPAVVRFNEVGALDANDKKGHGI